MCSAWSQRLGRSAHGCTTFLLSPAFQGVNFRPMRHDQKAAASLRSYEVTFFTLESACVYSIIRKPDNTWQSVLLNNIGNCAPLIYSGCTFNSDGAFLLVRGSDKRSVRCCAAVARAPFISPSAFKRDSAASRLPEADVRSLPGRTGNGV